MSCFIVEIANGMARVHGFRCTFHCFQSLAQEVSHEATRP